MATLTGKSCITKITNRLKKNFGWECKRFHGYKHSSAFVRLPNNRLLYFSHSDIEGFYNKDLLIRTAKHDKDYTGGQNNFVNLGNCTSRNLDIAAEKINSMFSKYIDSESEDV
jgi:hypothetical protein